MTDDKSEKENENENNGGVAGDEIKEDNVTTVDIIATGGVDDLVKVWEYTPDGEMKLKHKLSDHSLGVVSVDLSKDVKSKLKLLVKKDSLKLLYKYQYDVIIVCMIDVFRTSFELLRF